MRSSISNRQKKKSIEEGVRALRNKPGWDPASFVPADPMEKLLQLDQQSRDAATFAAAGECLQCTSMREASGDHSALCDEHLAKAMGF